jgi:hypothetical protein
MHGKEGRNNKGSRCTLISAVETALLNYLRKTEDK